MTFHHNLWAGGFGHTTTRALTLSPELERERGAIPFYGKKFIHLNYFARRKRRKQGIR
jgi:hypothetical protein